MRKSGQTIATPDWRARRNLIRIVDKPQARSVEQHQWPAYFTDLFDGLRAHSSAALAFNLIHVLRRVALVLIAMYVGDQPWIQTILFIAISEYACVYLWEVRPFESTTQNRVEIANEVLILILGYHMAVVTGFNVPSWHRYRVGVSTIAFILLLIALNVCRWALFVAHSLKLLFRRWGNRRRPRTAAELKERQKARERLQLAKQRRKRLALVSIETERGLITTERNNRRSLGEYEEDDAGVAAVAIEEEPLGEDLELKLRGRRRREREDSAAGRSERDEIEG